MALISVIVTTYNRPDALRVCLESLSAQTDRDFEILIADDGSDHRTRELIARRALELRDKMAMQHIFHEDLGFRAGAIRNKAVAASRGEYIVFMDGDCIAFPDFIAMHRKLAEPGFFVPGNRILISPGYTAEILRNNMALHTKPWLYFWGLFLTGKINHIGSLLRLPLGRLRRLQARKWKQAKTCNLGLWKSDFQRVNGFDELFEGWGYEDSDLVIRMIHRGIRRKSGRHRIPVLHLWHTNNDRSRADVNRKRLLARASNPEFIFAEKGFNQYTESAPGADPGL